MVYGFAAVRRCRCAQHGCQRRYQKWATEPTKQVAGAFPRRCQPSFEVSAAGGFIQCEHGTLWIGHDREPPGAGISAAPPSLCRPGLPMTLPSQSSTWKYGIHRTAPAGIASASPSCRRRASGLLNSVTHRRTWRGVFRPIQRAPYERLRLLRVAGRQFTQQERQARSEPSRRALPRFRPRKPRRGSCNRYPADVQRRTAARTPSPKASAFFTLSSTFATVT